MKLLKYLVFAFAFVGAFAVAYAAFHFFMNGNLDKLLGTQAMKEKAEAVTEKPVDPQVASLVEGFKKADQPVATAPEEGTQTTQSVSAGASSTTASILAKPVRTPDPNTKLIREWPTGRKWVALTFDDGPHPEWTPKFIELLKSKNVKATFFLIGPNAEKNPELAKALVESGFELGNHTMTHPQLNAKSEEVIRTELVSVNDIVKQAAGVQMGIMRPPYGKAPKKVQDVCDELGLKIITWNIDTADWDKKVTEQQMIDNVMKNVKDGSIILMHDRHEKSFNTTAAIIDKIRAQGYEFVTVSELIGLKPNESHPSTMVASAAGRAPQAKEAAASQSSEAGAMVAPVAPSAAATHAVTAEKTPVPAAQAPDGTQLPEVTPSKVTTIDRKGRPAR